MKLVPRAAKAKVTPLAPMIEGAAAQAMWLYYRDHKLQLISDISDYRADILAQLMAGVVVKEVFAPYFKPLEPVRVPRRAA